MYKMPGAPTPGSVSAMRANAELGVVNTSKKYQWQQPLVGPYGENGAQAFNPSARNEFPIVPVPKDTYDDIANIKATYAQKTQGTNWIVPFESGDAAYLARKRDAQEKALFDAWVMQKYDLTDPAQNLMLQRIAPELFSRREEVIDSQQELVSRYAKCRLRGAQSLSDLELEWLIETERLDLPKGPIWNPQQWRRKQTGTQGNDLGANARTDREWNQDRYYDGLFSPIKWLTTDTTGWQKSPLNPADIYGNPNARYENPSVPAPGPGWANVWGGNAPYPYAGGNAARTALNAPVPYAQNEYMQPGTQAAYYSRGNRPGNNNAGPAPDD